MEILYRTECADAAVAQYLPAAFAWGKRDCVRMVAHHIRRMGHPVSLVKAGEYSSRLGAVKALKRAGFDSVEAALDARFERIAPAAALPGDIIALPAEGAFPALAIRLSNGRVLHAVGEEGFAISEPLQFVAAWRVPCLKGLK